VGFELDSMTCVPKNFKDSSSETIDNGGKVGLVAGVIAGATAFIGLALFSLFYFVFLPRKQQGEKDNGSSQDMELSSVFLKTLTNSSVMETESAVHPLFGDEFFHGKEEF